MEEYRVLLADDEEEIRSGISRKIDWASLGFALVGEAGNGEEALELAEQLRPDVVLTDIKMPFLDGLELCRRLRVSLPGARLVVFSGFDDFEYARQAVGMGVSEYILKPINAPELRQVLEKLRDQLDRQRLERRDMETLRRRYEESLPVLRELFYTRLLSGQIRPEQVQDRAARYEIDLPQGLWTAALVHVDGLGDEGERDELLLLSVQSFLEKHFALEGCAARVVLYGDMAALLNMLKMDPGGAALPPSGRTGAPQPPVPELPGPAAHHRGWPALPGAGGAEPQRRRSPVGLGLPGAGGRGPGHLHRGPGAPVRRRPLL